VAKNRCLFVNSTVHCKAIDTIEHSICSLVEILRVGIQRKGLLLILVRTDCSSPIHSSWTAVRCQKFDEFVEESISSDEEEPPGGVPSSAKDWGDDADAWNTDEDDNQDAVVQTKKKEIKIEPEVKLQSMKITDEDQKDDDGEEQAAKSSSDEDEIDLDSKKKSQAKNVSVASSDAFNEWKRRHLQQTSAELTGQDQFPFYYIDIDEEEAVVNDAKLAEQKKLKKKCQQIDEDDDDDEETSKRGKEYVHLHSVRIHTLCSSENTRKHPTSNTVIWSSIVFNRRFVMHLIKSFGEFSSPWSTRRTSRSFSYDWSGQPLILTKTESSAQKCRHCQSPCHFEFQLMPALVNYLKIKQQIVLEFGTVFIYTCSNNCWNDQEDLYRLENVFVQADPDQSLFD
jgi:hypothetical protein